MMRVTIIPSDGMVGIDGEFRAVAGLVQMYPGVRAIQWGEMVDCGHVEFTDGSPNELITNPMVIQQAISAWEALTPLPPTDTEVLATAKTERIAAINTACAAAITGGFTSSALGALHTYDSEETDQINLIGAVSLGIDMPYKCADAAGIKAFRLHTAAQLKQVAIDGATVKLAALEKASALKARVVAAGTVGEVEVVVW
jgi:hypothetical protein